MNAIQNLLRRTIGLHSATIGASVIEHAVRSRMKELRLTRQEDYSRLLEESPLEWNVLVESVVIRETWFFRDPQSVLALVQLVRDEWLPAHPDGVLRLLSVPCSSGEEPYSLAMTLLDGGVPPERFQIDAVDISGRALLAGREGRYGRNSFRGGDLSFRARHFRPIEEDHQVKAEIKRQVRFRQGNFLADDCLSVSESYDFVFCRNLLIYFDSATQEKALQKLWRLLTPTGGLFLGPAEIPLALGRGFCSTDLPLSFACRKTAVPASPVEPRTQTKSAGQRLRTAHDPGAARSAPGLVERKTRIHRATMGDAANVVFFDNRLAEARRLAGEGRLAEAAEFCEIRLRESGACAEAYYLLGLVRNAAGAVSEAGEFYRRALYLEPEHYETLRDWASLSEKNGHTAHARILRSRADRARRPDVEIP